MPEYSPELAQRIIDRVAAGEPLARICREDGKPNRITFYEWCEKFPEIGLRFARAREVGYDHIADETRFTARGNPEFSTGDVARDKLIIETDLKLLSKWSKRYADKQVIEQTTTHKTEKAQELTNTELLALLHRAAAAGQLPPGVILADNGNLIEHVPSASVTTSQPATNCKPVTIDNPPATNK